MNIVITFCAVLSNIVLAGFNCRPRLMGTAAMLGGNVATSCAAAAVVAVALVALLDKAFVEAAELLEAGVNSG